MGIAAVDPIARGVVQAHLSGLDHDAVTSPDHLDELAAVPIAPNASSPPTVAVPRGTGCLISGETFAESVERVLGVP